MLLIIPEIVLFDFLTAIVVLPALRLAIWMLYIKEIIKFGCDKLFY